MPLNKIERNRNYRKGGEEKYERRYKRVIHLNVPYLQFLLTTRRTQTASIKKKKYLAI